MYQVSLKSEGVRPFFVITWPGITPEFQYCVMGWRKEYGLYHSTAISYLDLHCSRKSFYCSHQTRALHAGYQADRVTGYCYCMQM